MNDMTKETAIKISEDLGRIFEQRMAELRISRSNLAEQMGVHRASISALFRHEHGMSLSTMLKICEILNLSLEFKVVRES